MSCVEGFSDVRMVGARTGIYPFWWLRRHIIIAIPQGQLRAAEQGLMPCWVAMPS
jgi:hypothetical protein